MALEYHRWGDRKPEPNREFIVFDPGEGVVVMVRYKCDDDEDDAGGDVTWCPHTGKEHYGDMRRDYMWAYAPIPEVFGGP